jgi:hypothetical protein
VQLELVAEAEVPDHVEQLLQGDSLGVEQQLIARVENPQVAEHLPLRRQERRVAALSRSQALDVVADLSLQKGLGVRSGQRQLPAL